MREKELVVKKKLMLSLKDGLLILIEIVKYFLRIKNKHS